MGEWEVVGVIVVLLGLIATVTGPMIKLNTTLIRLATKVDNFTNGLEEFKKRYTEQLAKFEGVHEGIQDELDDHEHRITVLEHSKTAGGGAERYGGFK